MLKHVRNSKPRKAIKQVAFLVVLAGFMLITTGIWGWVHSFEHRHCDENHRPVQYPDPANCHICYELQFAIKSFETNIDTAVVSDLDFRFYVLQLTDQLIDESWEVRNFTRRGPPSA